jgi:hypothetical protein
MVGAHILKNQMRLPWALDVVVGGVGVFGGAICYAG